MPRRILIIEPNRHAADLLARQLAELRHESEHAQDWNEGLAQAARFKPDVAIVDTSVVPDSDNSWPARLRELMDGNGLLIGATEYSAGTPDAVDSSLDAHFYKPVPVLRFLRTIDS